MQKIMFNDRYGLTKAVLDGKKTQTRRLALRSKEDVQVLDGFDLKPEDKSIVQYVIDKYSRYTVGETVAVAQSYETIYKAMSELPEEEFEHPRIVLKNIDNLIKDARSTKVGYILDAQNLRKLKKELGLQIPLGNHLKKKYKERPIKVKDSAIIEKKNSGNLFSKENVLKYYYDTMCCSDNFKAGWKNKLFVKAELLPHHIRITGIRLERLQDISDEDCLKEGVSLWTEQKEYSSDAVVRKSVDELIAAGITPYQIPGCWDSYDSPRAAYAALIDKVSGKGTWERNPWVFVYDFELVK